MSDTGRPMPREGTHTEGGAHQKEAELRIWKILSLPTLKSKKMCFGGNQGPFKAGQPSKQKPGRTAQDNGRMSPRACQRPPGLALPSQAQSARAHGAQRFPEGAARCSPSTPGAAQVRSGHGDRPSHQAGAQLQWQPCRTEQEPRQGCLHLDSKDALDRGAPQKAPLGRAAPDPDPQSPAEPWWWPSRVSSTAYPSQSQAAAKGDCC